MVSVTKTAVVSDLADEMLETLKLAEIVMGNNIYPKPDVGPNHPYSILLKVRAVIAKAEGRS